MDEVTRQGVHQYIDDLFAQEDHVLREIQQEAARQQLPAISIRPHEGRFLQMLVKLVNAQKIVEIGTLAGYSGVWMARALPANGRLYTIDVSAKHAAIARAHFNRAGVDDRVQILQGQAVDMLRKLEPEAPFDFMFIDANKDQYPEYLEWGIQHLRVGGMLTAHNAIRDGHVLAPQDAEDQAVVTFNRILAEHPQLQSLILPAGDGFAMAVKIDA